MKTEESSWKVDHAGKVLKPGRGQAFEKRIDAIVWRSNIEEFFTKFFVSHITFYMFKSFLYLFSRSHLKKCLNTQANQKIYKLRSSKIALYLYGIVKDNLKGITECN